MSVCGIGMFIAMSSLATVEHLKHLHLLESPVMTALLVSVTSIVELEGADLYP